MATLFALDFVFIFINKRNQKSLSCFSEIRILFFFSLFVPFFVILNLKPIAVIMSEFYLRGFSLMLSWISYKLVSIAHNSKSILYSSLLVLIPFLPREILVLIDTNIKATEREM